MAVRSSMRDAQNHLQPAFGGLELSSHKLQSKIAPQNHVEREVDCVMRHRADGEFQTCLIALQIRFGN